MNSQIYETYRAMMKAGQFAEAADLAQAQCSPDNPGNPFWLTRQAAALSRSGRHQDALEIATQAYRLDPQNEYTLLAMAEAYLGLNRLDEAIQFFEGALPNPRTALFAQKGILRCLGAKRQWEPMLEYLAVWDLPKPILCQWKVKALESRHAVKEAIAACGEWLEIQPDNPAALWSLTALEIKRDGLDAVLERMERLARIGSRPPVYKEIFASLCRRAGKPEMALKQYESLSGTGTDPRILRKQAFAMAKSGREDEAIPIFEELLKREPQDIYLHSAYKGACGRKAQLGRALDFYEKLLEANPTVKTLYGKIHGIRKKIDAQ